VKKERSNSVSDKTAYDSENSSPSLSKQSDDSIMLSDDGSFKSGQMVVTQNFADSGNSLKPMFKKKVNLTNSYAFVIILKYYFTLDEKCNMFDLAKLQILNRRCHEYLVPMAMSQLRLYPEAPVCSLRSLESDI